MTGDQQEALLLFCAARPKTIRQIQQRFGGGVNPARMAHNGLLEIVLSGSTITRKAFKTTTKGADWVFDHRAKKVERGAA